MPPLQQVVRSNEIVLKLFMSLIREPARNRQSWGLEEKLKLVGGFPPSKVGSKALPYFEEERYVRGYDAADHQVFQLQGFILLEKGIVSDQITTIDIGIDLQVHSCSLLEEIGLLC